MLDENIYRKKIQEAYDRIDQALENVDPDLVEAEQSLGAMTLLMGDKTKCILSAQPSVRQLWLAIAAKGTAIHFNYDASSETWRDDKGKGIELLAYLQDYLREKTQLSLKF